MLTDDSSVLDYIEFQRSPSDPSACELFISAGGSTEKIATGLWKTFLAHIRAAQEQYAVNSSSSATIRLRGPHVGRDSRPSWFTKRTINRFVRFVSAPKVLERVKTIEDELVQLEQVRNIQARSLVQIEDTLVEDSTSLNADVSTMVQPGQNQDNSFGNHMEASKRHLLKAMDVRLYALQEEQNLAFSRAAKAGFEISIVEDLILFAEYFGADHLRAACNKFLELSKRRCVNMKAVDAVESTNLILSGNGVPAACKVSVSPSGELGQQSADESMGVSPRKSGNTSRGFSQRTSPRRRSMSPLKKIQVGRFGNRRSGSVVVRSINYFSYNDHTVNEGNSMMEFSGSDIEEHEKKHVEESRIVTASPLPTRRLSVQAAINLFEGKHKDKSKAAAKQKSVSKQSSLDNAMHSSGRIDNHEPNCDKMTSIVSKNNSQLIADEKVLSEGETKYVTKHVHIVQESSVNSGPHGNLKLTKNTSRNECNEELPRKFVESERQIGGNDPSCLRGFLTTDVAGIDIRSDSESKQYAHTSIPPAMSRSNMIQPEKIPTVIGDGVASNSCTNVERESVGNSWITSDINMEALTNMVKNPISKDEISEKQEGRFYEHYRKLRDAKMMEEQQSKRVEREAKLKLMKETLELRKAEMNARAGKLSKGGKHRQDQATIASREDVWSMEDPHSQDDMAAMQGKQCAASIQTKDLVLENSTPSPPMTPEATKERTRASKPYKSQATMSSQKSVSKSQNSTRAPSSVSPKSARRGISKISGYKQSISPSPGDNPLASSVPCFTDSRKENTKSTSGKLSGLNHVRPKNGSTARSTDKLSPSESTGSSHLPKSSINRTARKNRAAQSRYSYASDLKVLPSDNEDSATSLTFQEELDIDTSLPSKIRRSAVAPIHEGKSFLRKGSGIGPGAGPGVMKLKVFSTADVAAKVSDEDGPAQKDETDNNTNEVMATEEFVSALVQEAGEKEMEIETDVTFDADMTHHSDGGFFSVSVNEEKLEETCSAKDEEFHESEKVSHTISFPIDFGIHELYASSLGGDSVKQSRFILHGENRCDSHREAFLEERNHDLGKTHEDVTAHEGEGSSCPSKPVDETSAHLLHKGISRSHSTSFNVCDERTASNQSSVIASSPVKFMTASASDYCSPASGITMVESPDTSYASWNSSRVRYAGENQAVQVHSRCGISSQRPVVVVPPKEPVRGLKRLLKFARKTRAAPEVTLADCLSGSTISEGDDDSEDAKARNQSMNDYLKSRTQDRRSNNVGYNALPSEFGSYQQKGSSVESLLRSSIPVPPSTFKLKEDHASGSSRIKASRSFFSLPTFRSKSSEGKSR